MRTKIVGLIAVLTACSTPSAPAANQTADEKAVASPTALAKSAPPKAPPTPEPPLPTVDAGAGCADASLLVSPDAVVAKVGGKEIKFSDLGQDAAQAERDALHTYCRDVQRVRQAAVDRAIDDALLEAAAAKKGVDLDGYLREVLIDSVAEPTDKEIEAYYADNANDEAPPLEQVKSQVARVMKDERAKATYASLIGTLRKDGQVQLALPDVRPPAKAIDIPATTPTFGPADAPVTIVEFSDFECPYCAKAVPAIDALKKQYGKQVRFAFRHFPLSFHARARPAAKYAHCAAQQDKFWKVHDGIFESQRDLSDDSLRAIAQKAGVNMTKLDACLADAATDAAVDADTEAGRAAGVEGTPSFYVNGRPYDGAISAEGFARAVEQELAAAG